jgi:antitoxin Phd
MWTIQDAKNRFSAVVEAELAGVPHEVTRRGRPAVVVIAAEDYARLNETAGQQRPSIVEAIAACPDPDFDSTGDRTKIIMRDIAF